MTDETFRQAALAYGDTLYRVAFHALKNRADAEDVVQTVLLRLCQREEPFHGEDHLKHWLLRVTVNESRRLLRAFWRRRTVSLEEWDGTAEPAPVPSEVLEAVLALEPKYRLSIYLYYYEDCPVKEIARIMGANPSTVQTWLQRARARLKTALTGGEEEEGDPCV